MSMDASRPRSSVTKITVNGADDSYGNVPRSPMTAHPGVASAKPRLSLERVWQEADNDFFKDTGLHLIGGLPKQKRGVLDVWTRTYEVEDSLAYSKYKQMSALLQTVLDGIELIGAFAAQAASTVFAPASMCFNAISFLIEAPKMIKGVYDTLRELFEEVSDFLVRFKVLKHIDDKNMLDQDLVENTTNLLSCFVRICGLSMKVLGIGKHSSTSARLKTAMKVVILKDDSGVSAELATFRRLATSGTMLTGTVTLQHVLDSEELQKEVFALANETNLLVKNLAAQTNDEKTKLFNKDRLKTIKQKLFSKRDAFMEDSVQVLQFQEDYLPDTLKALEKMEDYQQWESPSRAGVRALVLTGKSGTGKSRIVECLKDKLDQKRETAETDAPSIYVAFYSFSSRYRRLGIEDKRTATSSIPYALKCIAYQVAEQSLNYAKALSRQLQEDKKLSSIEDSDINELWKFLKLSKFTAPKDSVLYLFFDDLEQEASNVKNLIRILLGGSKDQVSSDLNVRILLSGETKAFASIGGIIPAIDMEKLNPDLIHEFASRELQRLQLFHTDKKSMRQKEKVLKLLKDSNANNFNVVRQKFELLQVAVENDAHSDEMERIMLDDVGIVSQEEAKRVLANLASNLNDKQISQLNHLLEWMLFSNPRTDRFDELEAILYLEEESETLEPIAKKIKQRYPDILEVHGSWVSIRSDIEEVLRELEHVHRGASDAQPLINLNISIQNAPIQMVQQFIHRLKESIDLNNVNISATGYESKNKISVNVVEGHLRITRHLLRLLNEGWQELTEKLVWYAESALPGHLAALRRISDEVTQNEKKMIGQGLVAFLRDPYEFTKTGRPLSYSYSWLVVDENIEAVRFWLEETCSQLPSHERRWVKQVTQKSEGKLGHMKDLTYILAKNWLLGGDKAMTRDPYDTCILFDWVDDFITNNVEPEEDNSDNEEEAVATNDEDQASVEDSASAQHPASAQEPASVPNGSEQKSVEDIFVENSGKEETNRLSVKDLQAESTNVLREANPEADTRGGSREISVAQEGIDAERKVEESAHTETFTNGEKAPEAELSARKEEENNEQKVVEVDSNDSGSEVTPDITIRERIERALAWVQKELGITNSAVVHFNIANTALECREYDLAAEHFKLASDDPKFKWRALTGLANVNLEHKNKEDGIRQFREVIQNIEDQLERNELGKDEVTLYKDLLSQFGGWYQRLEQPEDALPLYQKALAYEQNDTDIKWTVLRISCTIGKYDEAFNILENWIEPTKDSSSKRLPDFFADQADDDPACWELRDLIVSIRDNKVRALVTTAVNDAVKVAKKRGNKLAVVGLMFKQGMLVGSAPDENRWQNATAVWESVLQLPPLEDDTDIGYRISLRSCLERATKCKFDILRARLLSSPDMLIKEKEGLCQELDDYIQSFATVGPAWILIEGNQMTNGYAVSIRYLIGAKEKARDHQRFSMSEALEILSDDDPDNDAMGIDNLCEIFARARDKVGILTAYSLFDRLERIKLQELKEGTITQNAADDRGNLDTWRYICYVCDKNVKSIDPEGIWRCHFCRQLCFCTTCHHKVLSGEILLPLCNPDHEFYRTYHTDYNADEIAEGKVRVGWEWRDIDKHEGTFERVGGDIIDIKDWVKQLRAAWNVAEPGKGSRAQR